MKPVAWTLPKYLGETTHLAPLWANDPRNSSWVELYTRESVDEAVAAERERCQPNGLMFDALGEPRTRYVRVTMDGGHCVMRPQEGDRYVQDARAAGDDSEYAVADVYLSEREFEDLPEFDGF